MEFIRNIFDWYFYITYGIGFIVWLVMLIIQQNNKNRINVFPYIIIVVFSPILVPASIMFGFIVILYYILNDFLPNLLFKDKQ